MFKDLVGIERSLKISQWQEKRGPKNHSSGSMDWKDNIFGNYWTLLSPVSWNMYQLPGLEWTASFALFQEHSIDEVSHLSHSFVLYWVADISTSSNKVWIIFYSALLLFHLDQCLILNRYSMNIIWLKKWTFEGTLRRIRKIEEGEDVKN